jgi:hypothetical protein
MEKCVPVSNATVELAFFDDEFNSIPSWIGSDESVQAKYVPRGLIYNHAAGVKTFVWLLAAGRMVMSTMTSASFTGLQITIPEIQSGAARHGCQDRLFRWKRQV